VRVERTDEFLAAVKAGEGDTVRRLLAAEPGLAMLRDRDGLSVLMVARYWSFRRSDIVDRILEARGEETLDIFEAAATGRAGRAAELLDDDPSRARAWSVDGYTPLHLAAFFGWESIADLLLAYGADPDLPSRNGQGVHPIHSAVAGGSFAIARLLVDAGADVNAAQTGGFRPIHAAAQNGDTATVDLLLQAGARLDLTTEEGATAAALAAAEGHAALAARLAALAGTAGD
jgi:ankyrin repeat protein